MKKESLNPNLFPRATIDPDLRILQKLNKTELFKFMSHDSQINTSSHLLIVIVGGKNRQN